MCRRGWSYRTEILENSRIYAVHFTTVDSYPNLAPAVITPPYPVALRNLFAGLHARYRVGLEHDLTCLSMFYEILAETARALPTPDGGGGSPKLRAVKAQIDRRFDDPGLSVAALAALAGWSEVYFRRAFRAAFGTSPLAYIRRVRLENAKALLRTGYYSVTETATRCGFDSISYFSYTFRRETGVTPSAYRERFL